MSKGKWVFYGCIAVLGLLLINGCATVKTVYDACRGGYCR